MATRRGRPRTFPKKPEIFARRLWACSAYRDVNAKVLSGLTKTVTRSQIYDLSTDPNITELTKQNSDRLDELARVLLVDADWLRGKKTTDEPKLIAAFLDREREMAHRANPKQTKSAESLTADAWWLAFEAGWRRIICTTKDGKLQQRLIEIIGAPDADKKDWPTYQRRDLCWPMERMNGYETLPLRPIRLIFTVGQALALAPVLIPGEVPPSRANLTHEQRCFAKLVNGRGTGVPDPFRSLVEFTSRPFDADGMALAGYVMSLSTRKSDAGTYGALIDVLERKRNRIAGGQSSLRKLLVWSFLTGYPDDKPMSLTALINLYRRWNELYRPKKAVASVLLPDDQDLRPYRHRRMEIVLHRYEGKIIPLKIIDEEMEWVTYKDKGHARVAIDALIILGLLIPRGTSHVLVADPDDQKRWQRWQSHEARTQT